MKYLVICLVVLLSACSDPMQKAERICEKHGGPLDVRSFSGRLFLVTCNDRFSYQD